MHTHADRGESTKTGQKCSHQGHLQKQKGCRARDVVPETKHRNENVFLGEDCFSHTEKKQHWATESLQPPLPHTGGGRVRMSKPTGSHPPGGEKVLLNAGATLPEESAWTGWRWQCLLGPCTHWESWALGLALEPSPDAPRTSGAHKEQVPWSLSEASSPTLEGPSWVSVAPAPY